MIVCYVDITQFLHKAILPEVSAATERVTVFTVTFTKELVTVTHTFAFHRKPNELRYSDSQKEILYFDTSK